MENEAKERAAVSRGQNALYVLPHDAAAPDEFLAPWLERLESASDALQLLVVTGDSESAASLAGAIVRMTEGAALRVVPVAGSRRAERRVRAGAHVVIGAASDLIALVRASALKLDDLRAVIVAWADELPAADAEALEALFAEIPKTAARTVVATESSEAVEALVERYARRPRRSGAGDEAGAGGPVAVGFVTTAAAGRAAALRRVIDALDPEVTRVYARTDESARIAGGALAAMGYRGDDAAATVTRDAAPTGDPADLVVLFDLPPSAAALSAIASSARRAVVLVQPRQLASLRRLALGGAVTPVALPENTTRGHAEVAALRNALLAELSGSSVGRELLVLEPLLDDHDPIELAAAALRLAGRSGRATAGASPAGTAASTGPTGPMTKIFINVGEMDNARPGDLVGAIINEGGAQRDQVGRIDVRDKHAVVEVESSIAEQVIERLSGSAIRGRRVQARVDQDRPARSERPARPERPERGERSERPERGERPSRPRSDFGDRPARPRSFDRDRPPARGGDRERPPARSFDRDRPPARSFDRPARGGSDRPARPARDRDDRGPSSGRSGPAARGAAPRSPNRPTRPRRGDT